MVAFDWQAWFDFVDPLVDGLSPVNRGLPYTEAMEIQAKVNEWLGRRFDLPWPATVEPSPMLYGQFITILPVVNGVTCSYSYDQADDGRESISLALLCRDERLEFVMTGEPGELTWNLTAKGSKFRISASAFCSDREDRAKTLERILRTLN